MINKLKHTQFLKHFLNYSFNDLLLLLIPLIIIPLISNTYGRELYGLFVVAKVIASSLGVVIDLGYRNIGIVGVEETDDYKEYFENSTSLKILVFITLGILYFIISLILDLKPIYFILYLSNIEFILIPRFLLISRRWLPLLSKVFFTLGTIQVCSILFIIYFKLSLIWIAAAFPFSYLIAGVVCFIGIKRKEKKLITYSLFTKIYLPKDRSRNLNYLGKNIIGIIKDKLAYLITQIFVGNTSILELDIGLRLINLFVKPYSIVNNLLIKSGSKNKFNRRYFDVQIKWILITSTILVLLTLFIAPKLLPIIFKEQLNYTPIFILIFSLIFLSISSFINSNILVLRNKTDKVFRATVVVTTYYLISLIVLLKYTSLNPLLGITISITTTYFIEFLIVNYYKHNLQWEK